MNLSQNMLLAGLLGGVVLILFTLICVVFTHFQEERKLTHAERIKALEMGQTLPDDPETARIKARAARLAAARSTGSSGVSKSLAYHCYSVTGYICGGGFFFAILVGGSTAYALASAAGAIGVTGMICGTILATKEVRSEPSMTTSKPRFDPETV